MKQPDLQALAVLVLAQVLIPDTRAALVIAHRIKSPVFMATPCWPASSRRLPIVITCES